MTNRRNIATGERLYRPVNPTRPCPACGALYLRAEQAAECAANDTDRDNADTVSGAGQPR